MGESLAAMIVQANSYSTYYTAAYEPIGEDPIIGDEGMRDILCGLRTLLDADTGAREASDLSAAIARTARDFKFLDARGELTTTETVLRGKLRKLLRDMNAKSRELAMFGDDVAQARSAEEIETFAGKLAQILNGDPS